MPHFSHTFTIETLGKGLYEITEKVAEWAEGQGIVTGLLTVFVPHTSASLLIQENADPDVIRDLNDFFARLVPENKSLYRHTAEGSDDMPAHIRAALTQIHLSIPLRKGKPALGTWQGIYLFEHRVPPHRRTILLHLCGD